MTNTDGAVLFGASNTVANPKQARATPPPYWTPWTIQDVTTAAPAGSSYAPCVSCHDPHGVDDSGYTCLAPGEGYMVKKNYCNPIYFCNSNCHTP
jgi:hypothetical protein